MRTLLPFLILVIHSTLVCAESIEFNYGISYPKGSDIGFDINGDNYNSSLLLNVKNGEYLLGKGYFRSDFLSLGSISFNGLLNNHQKENLSFLSLDEQSESIIHTSEDPPDRKGVIFGGYGLLWGLTGFREKELSEILFWSTFPLDKTSFLSISQSCSFLEQTDPVSSWYLDEYSFNSRINLNTGVTYFWKNDSYTIGGSIFLSVSPNDSPGSSFHIYCGISPGNFFIQNEIMVNTKHFRAADMELNKYPFVYKGKLSYELNNITFDSSLIALFEKEPLLLQSRLWSIKSISAFGYDNSLWKLNSKITLLVENDTSGTHFFSYNIDFSAKRLFSSFFVEAGGKAGYDTIFKYSAWFEGGYNSSLLEFSLSTKLKIERDIDFDGIFKGKIKMEHFNILLSLAVENIPFYNCRPDSLEFSFFTGIEIIHQLTE